MTSTIVTRKRSSIVTSPYFSTPTTKREDVDKKISATTIDTTPKTSNKKINRKQIKIEYEKDEKQKDDKQDEQEEDKKVEEEEEEEEEEEIKESPLKKKKKHSKKEEENTSSNKGETLSKIHWEEVWKKISIMRSKYVAPVDSMGAESFDLQHIEPTEKRLHILTGCLLSSQTKDAITHAAVNRLKEHGLTVDNIIKTPLDDLEKLIYPVGFYKRKAVYLKKIVEILKDKYNSDIPKTFKEIESLPGVGPKMTNLIVQIAWGRVEGIAVDVHVHRISNRLGWVNTKTPEETMKQLESWLPKDRWRDVNHLLVGFGQTICLPVNPKCQSCNINNLCPIGIKEMKTINKKDKTTTTTTNTNTLIKKEN